MLPLTYLSETDSTNSWLRANGGEEDMMVCTEYQTAGRGSGPNTWESERGKNLLYSVLLHPTRVPAASQFILSMANALALWDTLSNYLSDIKIKWPNDIYWKDQKICGTLIEPTLQGPFIKSCIIGTGININQQTFRSDAPNPVSMSQILGHEVDRKDVLEKVIINTCKYIDEVKAGDWDAIRTHYRSHLYRLGETHSYRFSDGSEAACKLTNVSDDGHLELLHPHRGPLRFTFKEVQFVV